MLLAVVHLRHPNTASPSALRLLTSRNEFEREDNSVHVGYFGIEKVVGQLMLIDYDTLAKIFLSDHDKQVNKGETTNVLHHGDVNMANARRIEREDVINWRLSSFSVGIELN